MTTNRTHLALIRRVLKAFLKDWDAHPHRWSREAEVQLELAARLLREFHKDGNDVIHERGGKTLNRVTIERPVKGPNGTPIRHDIEILADDGEDSRALWVCEVKCKPGGYRDPKVGWSQDKDQIRWRLRQRRKGAWYGCCIMLRIGADSPRLPELNQDWETKTKGRLWLIDLATSDDPR